MAEQREPSVVAADRTGKRQPDDPRRCRANMGLHVESGTGKIGSKQFASDIEREAIYQTNIEANKSVVHTGIRAQQMLIVVPRTKELSVCLRQKNK